jgi:RNA-binding protein YhbY
MDKNTKECIEKLIKTLEEELGQREVIKLKLLKDDYINLIRSLLEQDKNLLIESIEKSRLILLDQQ